MRLFDKWLNEREQEDERLRFLSEAFEEKDAQRIADIISKSNGDRDRELSLARMMANKITDADKAQRRADAAGDAGKMSMAKVFQDRANELSGKSSSPVASSAPEEEDEEENAPAPVRTVPPKAAPKPLQRKINVGDYFKVSANMIMEKKIAISDGKSWRFITPSNTGNRQVRVNTATAGKYVKPRYGGKYATRQWEEGTPGISHIDETYLKELGEEGIFYIKAKKISGTVIEGYVHFPNGLVQTEYLTRFAIKDVIPNGEELKIFLANSQLLSTANYCRRFVMGEEAFLYKKNGEVNDDVVPGNYTTMSLDYVLTRQLGEPVVYCSPSENTDMTHAKVIFCALKDFMSLKETIDPEQIAVVASFFGKAIGAEVTVDSRNDFEIPWFKVDAERSNNYLDGYYAKPFFTTDLAEEHIASLKEIAKTKKLPYDVSKLKVSTGGTYDISFSKLMDYAKLVGIEVKLKQFFEEKRGQVKAKKFGF